MSSFQDMTYYDSIIGNFLYFFLCNVKNIVWSKIVLVITKFLLLFLSSFYLKNHRVSILVTENVYHAHNDNNNDNNNDIVTGIAQLKTFGCAKNEGLQTKIAQNN